MKQFLTKITSAGVDGGAAYEMNLKYYVTEDNTPGGAPLYGVRIVKSYNLPESTYNEEENEIRRIFSNRADAENFLDVLCRGTVTPMSLNDIAEEYILEKLLSA
ncbi:MAG: hypothetical protein J6N52_01560 [Clostridia bacterium]|nr:hypothetical protein [Clostridia bacterium]